MDDFVKVDGYQEYPEYLNQTEQIILDRKISKIVATTATGDTHSQYIKFRSARYITGVDLAKMKLQIHYERPDGTGSECEAVNVYVNETEIVFGWIMPLYATAQKGNLKVAVWAYGETDKGEYLYKTVPLIYPIQDSFGIGEGIVEPDEGWFLQFYKEMHEKMATVEGDKLSVAYMKSDIENLIDDQKQDLADQLLQSKQDLSQTKDDRLYDIEAFVIVKKDEITDHTGNKKEEITQVTEDSKQEIIDLTTSSKNSINENLATETTTGFMSAGDFVKLQGIEDGANKYTHPIDHPPSIIKQDVNNMFVTDAQLQKLTGIEDGANKYVHPTSDGSLHVPATGNQNGGKFLVAGESESSFSWLDPLAEDVDIDSIYLGDEQGGGLSPGDLMWLMTNVIDPIKSDISDLMTIVDPSTSSLTFPQNGFTTATIDCSDGVLSLSADSVSINGFSIKSSVPSNALFTDKYKDANASVNEVNYLVGVTSKIQDQINDINKSLPWLNYDSKNKYAKVTSGYTIGYLDVNGPRWLPYSGSGSSFFIRNDGDYTYFMHTAPDDIYGTYTTNRPIIIDNKIGRVTLGDTSNVATSPSATDINKKVATTEYVNNFSKYLFVSGELKSSSLANIPIIYEKIGDMVHVHIDGTSVTSAFNSSEQALLSGYLLPAGCRPGYIRYFIVYMNVGGANVGNMLIGIDAGGQFYVTCDALVNTPRRFSGYCCFKAQS